MVLAEEIKAFIRDRYSALIWINCAEREVFGSSLAFGQHVEKSGFPAATRIRRVSNSDDNNNTSHICLFTHATCFRDSGFTSTMYVPNIR